MAYKINCAQRILHPKSIRVLSSEEGKEVRDFIFTKIICMSFEFCPKNNINYLYKWILFSRTPFLTPKIRVNKLEPTVKVLLEHSYTCSFTHSRAAFIAETELSGCTKNLSPRA